MIFGDPLTFLFWALRGQNKNKVKPLLIPEDSHFHALFDILNFNEYMTFGGFVNRSKQIYWINYNDPRADKQLFFLISNTANSLKKN